LFTDISQKSRRSLQPKTDSTLTSPNNTTKLPSTNSRFSPQNPSSLQTIAVTDTTAKADEIKAILTDITALSPNTTTGSAKGTANASNKAVATGCDKTPHCQAVAGELLSSPLTRAGPVKPNHPGQHQTRRQRFDIITGHPLQSDSGPAPTLKSSPTFTSSINKINTCDVNSNKGNTEVNVEAASSAEQFYKAPHLDMRRNKNSSFSGLSTYRASFKPAPGFYSSCTMGPTATGAPRATNPPWDSSSTLMNYSRHSATVSHNSKTLKGAPLNSGFVLSTGSDSSLLG
jgi:hypothetical protein